MTIEYLMFSKKMYDKNAEIFIIDPQLIENEDGNVWVDN